MREYIRRLERRKKWLQSQVDSTRSDLGYTKAELAALKYAIACMNFVKDGFYEILMNKKVNLTTEQIVLLEKLKVRAVKNELYRQHNDHASTDNS